MQSTLTPVRVIVLPGWIHRGLIRNRINLNNMLDYGKIKTVLSVDDMATLLYVNEVFKLDGIYLSTLMLQDLFENIDIAQRTELSNSVLPLSRSEDIALNTVEKLSGSNPMSDCDYSFTIINNIIFLVLNEGFIPNVINAGKKLEFIKDYLKACYGCASIPEVSSCDMFKLYIKQLQN